MNDLFEAFSKAYVKALEATEKNNFSLARKQYLLMLHFHERIQAINSKTHILDITHNNITKVFSMINKT
ncbi:hypothetical protein HYV79_04785 [Candidatus Woesearchaeota archaeon]|nr:hypothetical protein [Candidatus Woesearchaeota archaeon]